MPPLTISARLLLAVCLLLSLPLPATSGTQDSVRLGLHWGPYAPPISCPTLSPGCDVPGLSSNLQTSGAPVGSGYAIYIIAMDIDPSSGLTSVEFALGFNDTPGAGTLLALPKICGGIDFSDVNWPYESGSGTKVTWVGCENTVDPGDPQGEAFTVVASIYAYAYASDAIRIIPRSGTLGVEDCSASFTDLTNTSLTSYPDNMGRLGSGNAAGYDPCSGDFSPVITPFTASGNLGNQQSASFAWGDYDNDGDLDLLTAGTGGTILHENNAGVLSAPGDGLPDVVGAVDWGDYDNDGDLDVLISGSLISAVYENEGGTFSDIGAGLPGLNFSSCEWGDYDNDGDLDILLTGSDASDHSVSRIYRNDGGIFSDISAGIMQLSGDAAWGDFDNDGDLDVAQNGMFYDGGAAPQAHTRVYRNTGGVFTLAATLVGSSRSVDWGDYDNDGDLDLVITGTTGSVFPIPQPITRVYTNNGGTFSDASAGLMDVLDSRAIWGDYDNDGDLDIFLSGYEPDLFLSVNMVYENTGSSFISLGNLFPAQDSDDAAWGDYDNDGDLDLVLAGLPARIYENTYASPNTAPSAPTNLDASLVGSTVTFSWDPATDSETPGNGLSYNLYAGSSPLTGDLVSSQSDTSGYRKVVRVGNAQKSTSWTLDLAASPILYWGVQAIDTAFEGSPFASQALVTVPFADNGAGLTGFYESSVDWGDYDNDGDLDFAVCGLDPGLIRVSRIYRNDAGVFTDIAAGLHGVGFGSVDWGDYDNDGDLDLLLTGGDGVSNICRIYRNDAGSFTDIGAAITQVLNSDAAWGDYDNDGDLDFVLAGRISGITYVSAIYRNDSGVFTDIGASIADMGYSSVAWEDYDTDGDLDLLMTGVGGGQFRASLYENDGGVFTDIAAGLTGVYLGSVAWGDYDNDGDPDLLLTGRDSGEAPVARVYENNAGVFTDIGAGITPVGRSSVAWGDYDNDGDLDILLSGDTGSAELATVYENDGGSFTDILPPLPGVELGSVAWGDYDDDGDLDILLSGRDAGNTPILHVFDNLSLTPNTVPGAPANLDAVRTDSLITFTWDAATDAETPSGGLGYNLYVGTVPLGQEVVASASDNTDGFRRMVHLGNARQNLTWALIDPPGGTLYWSVQAVDAAFAGSPFATGEIESPVVTAVGDGSGTPTAFGLRGAMPNPFRAGTRIAFELPTDASVSLEVFDITGRRIRTLVREPFPAGNHEVAWDGADEAGHTVAAGVYLYRLRAGEFTSTKRVVLTR